MKIRSAVDGCTRIGRASCFASSNVLRVRFSSGLEEEVTYSHTYGTDDVNDYSLPEFTGSFATLADGAAMEMADCNEGNVLNYLNNVWTRTTHSNISAGQATKSLATDSYQNEGFKYFKSVETYFASMQGKKPRVVFNMHVPKVLNAFPVLQKVVPLLDDDNAVADLPNPPGYITGRCFGRVTRGKECWTLVLRNAIIRIDQFELLFSSLIVKIDPTSVLIPDSKLSTIRDFLSST